MNWREKTRDVLNCCGLLSDSEESPPIIQKTIAPSITTDDKSLWEKCKTIWENAGIGKQVGDLSSNPFKTANLEQENGIWQKVFKKIEEGEEENKPCDANTSPTAGIHKDTATNSHLPNLTCENTNVVRKSEIFDDSSDNIKTERKLDVCSNVCKMNNEDSSSDVANIKSLSEVDEDNNDNKFVNIDEDKNFNGETESESESSISSVDESSEYTSTDSGDCNTMDKRVTKVINTAFKQLFQIKDVRDEKTVDRNQSESDLLRHVKSSSRTSRRRKNKYKDEATANFLASLRVGPKGEPIMQTNPPVKNPVVSKEMVEEFVKSFNEETRRRTKMKKGGKSAKRVSFNKVPVTMNNKLVKEQGIDDDEKDVKKGILLKKNEDEINIILEKKTVADKGLARKEENNINEEILKTVADQGLARKEENNINEEMLLEKKGTNVQPDKKKRLHPNFMKMTCVEVKEYVKSVLGCYAEIQTGDSDSSEEKKSDDGQEMVTPRNINGLTVVNNAGQNDPCGVIKMKNEMCMQYIDAVIDILSKEEEKAAEDKPEEKRKKERNLKQENTIQGKETEEDSARIHNLEKVKKVMNQGKRYKRTSKEKQLQTTQVMERYGNDSNLNSLDTFCYKNFKEKVNEIKSLKSTASGVKIFKVDGLPMGIDNFNLVEAVKYFGDEVFDHMRRMCLPEELRRGKRHEVATHVVTILGNASKCCTVIQTMVIDELVNVYVSKCLERIEASPLLVNDPNQRGLLRAALDRAASVMGDFFKEFSISYKLQKSGLEKEVIDAIRNADRTHLAHEIIDYVAYQKNRRGKQAVANAIVVQREVAAKGKDEDMLLDVAKSDIITLKGINLPEGIKGPVFVKINLREGGKKVIQFVSEDHVFPEGKEFGVTHDAAGFIKFWTDLTRPKIAKKLAERDPTPINKSAVKKINKMKGRSGSIQVENVDPNVAAAKILKELFEGELRRESENDAEEQGLDLPQDDTPKIKEVVKSDANININFIEKVLEGFFRDRKEEIMNYMDANKARYVKDYVSLDDALKMNAKGCRQQLVDHKCEVHSNLNATKQDMEICKKIMSSDILYPSINPASIGINNKPDNKESINPKDTDRVAQSRIFNKIMLWLINQVQNEGENISTETQLAEALRKMILRDKARRRNSAARPQAFGKGECTLFERYMQWLSRFIQKSKQTSVENPGAVTNIQHRLLEESIVTRENTYFEKVMQWLIEETQNRDKAGRVTGEISIVLRNMIQARKLATAYAKPPPLTKNIAEDQGINDLATVYAKPQTKNIAEDQGIDDSKKDQIATKADGKHGTLRYIFSDYVKNFEHPGKGEIPSQLVDWMDDAFSGNDKDFDAKVWKASDKRGMVENSFAGCGEDGNVPTANKTDEGETLLVPEEEIIGKTNAAENRNFDVIGDQSAVKKRQVEERISNDERREDMKVNSIEESKIMGDGDHEIEKNTSVETLRRNKNVPDDAQNVLTMSDDEKREGNIEESKMMADGNQGIEEKTSRGKILRRNKNVPNDPQNVCAMPDDEQREDNIKESKIMAEGNQGIEEKTSGGKSLRRIKNVPNDLQNVFTMSNDEKREDNLKESKIKAGGNQGIEEKTSGGKTLQKNKNILDDHTRKVNKDDNLEAQQRHNTRSETVNLVSTHCRGIIAEIKVITNNMLKPIDERDRRNKGKAGTISKKDKRHLAAVFEKITSDTQKVEKLIANTTRQTIQDEGEETYEDKLKVAYRLVEGIKESLRCLMIKAKVPAVRVAIEKDIKKVTDAIASVYSLSCAEMDNINKKTSNEDDSKKAITDTAGKTNDSAQKDPQKYVHKRKDNRSAAYQLPIKHMNVDSESIKMNLQDALNQIYIYSQSKPSASTINKATNISDDGKDAKNTIRRDPNQKVSKTDDESPELCLTKKILASLATKNSTRESTIAFYRFIQNYHNSLLSEAQKHFENCNSYDDARATINISYYTDKSKKTNGFQNSSQVGGEKGDAIRSNKRDVEAKNVEDIMDSNFAPKKVAESSENNDDEAKNVEEQVFVVAPKNNEEEKVEQDDEAKNVEEEVYVEDTPKNNGEEKDAESSENNQAVDVLQNTDQKHCRRSSQRRDANDQTLDGARNNFASKKKESNKKPPLKQFMRFYQTLENAENHEKLFQISKPLKTSENISQPANASMKRKKRYIETYLATSTDISEITGDETIASNKIINCEKRVQRELFESYCEVFPSTSANTAQTDLGGVQSLSNETINQLVNNLVDYYHERNAPETSINFTPPDSVGVEADCNAELAVKQVPGSDPPKYLNLVSDEMANNDSIADTEEIRNTLDYTNSTLPDAKDALSKSSVITTKERCSELPETDSGEDEEQTKFLSKSDEIFYTRLCETINPAYLEDVLLVDSKIREIIRKKRDSSTPTGGDSKTRLDENGDGKPARDEVRKSSNVASAKEQIKDSNSTPQTPRDEMQNFPTDFTRTAVTEEVKNGKLSKADEIFYTRLRETINPLQLEDVLLIYSKIREVVRKKRDSSTPSGGDYNIRLDENEVRDEVRKSSNVASAKERIKDSNSTPQTPRDEMQNFKTDFTRAAGTEEKNGKLDVANAQTNLETALVEDHNTRVEKQNGLVCSKLLPSGDWNDHLPRDTYDGEQNIASFVSPVNPTPTRYSNDEHNYSNVAPTEYCNVTTVESARDEHNYAVSSSESSSIAEYCDKAALFLSSEDGNSLTSRNTQGWNPAVTRNIYVEHNYAASFFPSSSLAEGRNPTVARNTPLFEGWNPTVARNIYDEHNYDAASSFPSSSLAEDVNPTHTPLIEGWNPNINRHAHDKYHTYGIPYSSNVSHSEFWGSNVERNPIDTEQNSSDLMLLSYPNSWSSSTGYSNSILQNPSPDFLNYPANEDGIQPKHHIRDEELNSSSENWLSTVFCDEEQNAAINYLHDNDWNTFYRELNAFVLSAITSVTDEAKRIIDGIQNNEDDEKIEHGNQVADEEIEDGNISSVDKNNGIETNVTKEDEINEAEATNINKDENNSLTKEVITSYQNDEVLIFEATNVTKGSKDETNSVTNEAEAVGLIKDRIDLEIKEANVVKDETNSVTKSVKYNEAEVVDLVEDGNDLKTKEANIISDQDSTTNVTNKINDGHFIELNNSETKEVNVISCIEELKGGNNEAVTLIHGEVISGIHTYKELKYDNNEAVATNNLNEMEDENLKDGLNPAIVVIDEDLNGGISTREVEDEQFKAEQDLSTEAISIILGDEEFGNNDGEGDETLEDRRNPAIVVIDEDLNSGISILEIEDEQFKAEQDLSTKAISIILGDEDFGINDGEGAERFKDRHNPDILVIDEDLNCGISTLKVEDEQFTAEHNLSTEAISAVLGDEEFGNNDGEGDERLEDRHNPAIVVIDEDLNGDISTLEVEYKQFKSEKDLSTEAISIILGDEDFGNNDGEGDERLKDRHNPSIVVIDEDSNSGISTREVEDEQFKAEHYLSPEVISIILGDEEFGNNVGEGNERFKDRHNPAIVVIDEDLNGGISTRDVEDEQFKAGQDLSTEAISVVLGDEDFGNNDGEGDERLKDRHNPTIVLIDEDLYCGISTLEVEDEQFKPEHNLSTEAISIILGDEDFGNNDGEGNEGLKDRHHTAIGVIDEDSNGGISTREEYEQFKAEHNLSTEAISLVLGGNNDGEGANNENNLRSDENVALIIIENDNEDGNTETEIATILNELEKLKTGNNPGMDVAESVIIVIDAEEFKCGNNDAHIFHREKEVENNPRNNDVTSVINSEVEATNVKDLKDEDFKTKITNSEAVQGKCKREVENTDLEVGNNSEIPTSSTPKTVPDVAMYRVSNNSIIQELQAPSITIKDETIIIRCDEDIEGSLEIIIEGPNDGNNLGTIIIDEAATMTTVPCCKKNKENHVKREVVQRKCEREVENTDLKVGNNSEIPTSPTPKTVPDVAMHRVSNNSIIQELQAPSITIKDETIIIRRDENIEGSLEIIIEEPNYGNNQGTIIIDEAATMTTVPCSKKNKENHVKREVQRKCEREVENTDLKVGNNSEIPTSSTPKTVPDVAMYRVSNNSIIQELQAPSVTIKDETIIIRCDENIEGSLEIIIEEPNDGNNQGTIIIDEAVTMTTVPCCKKIKDNQVEFVCYEVLTKGTTKINRYDQNDEDGNILGEDAATIIGEQFEDKIFSENQKSGDVTGIHGDEDLRDFVATNIHGADKIDEGVAVAANFPHCVELFGDENTSKIQRGSTSIIHGGEELVNCEYEATNTVHEDNGDESTVEGITHEEDNVIPHTVFEPGIVNFFTSVAQLFVIGEIYNSLRLPDDSNEDSDDFIPPD